MNRELAFSLVLKDGKVFVKDAEESFVEVARTGEQAGKKVSKSFDNILSRDALLRLGTGVFVLGRLARGADVADESLGRVRGEASEAARTMGSELQVALGAVAQSLEPMIKKFNEADGGVHGFLLGLIGLTTVGPVIKETLLAMGAAAGPVALLLTTGFLLSGAAVGHFTQNSLEAKAETERLAASLKSFSTENLREQLALATQELEKFREEKRRLVDEGAETQNQNLALLKQLNILDEEINKRKQIISLIEKEISLKPGGPVFQATDENLSVDEFIAKKNTEIALGKVSLSDAKASAAEKAKEAKEIRDAVTAADNLTSTVEQRKKAEQDLNSILSFQKDLTTRSSQQAEKQSSESLNRRILEAQVLDLINQEGPKHERNVILAERERLIREGHKENEIQLLELDKQSLELGKQIQTVTLARVKAEQEAGLELNKAQQEARKFAEQEFNQQQTMLAFSKAINLSLAQLSGQSETQIRRQQIRDLQEELNLQNLNLQTLRAKRDELILQAGFSANNDAQKQALEKLIQLLNEEREAAQKLPRELEFIGSGLETAARAGSHALAGLFLKGKADAKQFAKDLENIFVRMLEDLLANTLLKTFIQLFLSVLFPGGGGLIGGAAGDLITGGGNLASVGGTPNLPIPRSISNFGSTIDSRFERMEQMIATMGRDINRMADSSFKQVSTTLEGGHIRTVLVREETSAKGRNLG